MTTGAWAGETDDSHTIDEGWEYLVWNHREAPSEDATGWVPVKVGASLSSQGFQKGEVYGWYRVRFDLPNATSLRDPALYLGPIETFDKTWLNGVEISTSESGLDLPTRARLYPVPKDLYREKNNELLVRIHQLGVGGIYHEAPRAGEWRPLERRKSHFEFWPKLIDLIDVTVLTCFLVGHILLWFLAGKRGEFLLFALADAAFLPFLIVYSLPWVEAGLKGYFGGGLIVAVWVFAAVGLSRRLSGIVLPAWWRWCYLLLIIGAVLEFAYFLGTHSNGILLTIAQGFLSIGLVPIMVIALILHWKHVRNFSPKLLLLILGFLALFPLGLSGVVGILPVHPLFFEYVFFHGANLVFRLALLGSALLHIRDIDLHRLARAKGSVEALESEQLRLARELHDGIASATYGMKIKVQLLAKRHPESQEIANEIINDLGDTARDVRHVSNNLRPALLESLGLVEALREWAKTSTTGSPIAQQMVIQISPDFPEPPPETALHLFRIVQEATANAIRHGQAKTITVFLEESIAGMNLEVSDDGCGLPKSRDHLEGSGLNSMRDRAKLMKGSFLIRKPHEKSGTVISVIIPRWT